MGRFTRHNHRASIVTGEQVISIRQQYADGTTQRELAALYQLSAGQIGRIVRGESWAGLTRPPRQTAPERSIEDVKAYMAAVPPTPQEQADATASAERLARMLGLPPVK